MTVEEQSEKLKRLLEQASALIASGLAASGTLAAIQKDAWSYSAAVFTIAGRKATFMGSGTFVLARGRPHLLTAAHVWEQLSRADGFALKFDESIDSLVLRPDRERVRVLPEVMSGTLSAWTIDGPDLALIALPDPCTSIVERTKRFYDLRLRPQPAPDAAGAGIWGVLGIPAELSTLEPGPQGELFIGLFHSFVVHRADRGDLDYVDIRYDREAEPDQPRKYNGVSGGGLWHAAPNETGAWRLSLEGVAFWQEGDESSAKRGFIRCHGRRTVDLLVHGRPSRPPT